MSRLGVQSRLCRRPTRYGTNAMANHMDSLAWLRRSKSSANSSKIGLPRLKCTSHKHIPTPGKWLDIENLLSKFSIQHLLRGKVSIDVHPCRKFSKTIGSLGMPTGIGDKFSLSIRNGIVQNHESGTDHS